MELRRHGENSRMVKEENGEVHFISDWSQLYCPEGTGHCLECIYMKDQYCPLERAEMSRDL
jgi:hypothetical protein